MENINPINKRKRLIIIFLVIILILTPFFIYVWYTGVHCMLRPDIEFLCVKTCPTIRESCYTSVASSSINFDCHRLYSMNEKYVGLGDFRRCFEKSAAKDNPAICLDHTKENSMWCIREFASVLQDPSICRKYSSVFEGSSEKWLTSGACVEIAGGTSNSGECKDISDTNNRQSCYFFTAEKMEDNCEIILEWDMDEEDKKETYLDCIKRKAEKEKNIDLCRSCEGNTNYCNPTAISECYFYYGIYSNSVDPCFYQNYLFLTETEYSLNFLNCYEGISQSASSPFGNTWLDASITYLYDYCKSLTDTDSKEKIQCKRSLDYLKEKWGKN